MRRVFHETSNPYIRGAVRSRQRRLSSVSLGLCAPMPMQHYAVAVIRAVVPPLIPWVARVFAHPRITEPEDNGIVGLGKTLVSGTYRSECGISFVLLHHRDTQYWPQGGPVLDRTRRTWQKDVHINAPATDKHFISIAAYADEVRPLLDYYYQAGKATGQYTAITLYKLPKGLTILHTIRVQPKKT